MKNTDRQDIIRTNQFMIDAFIMKDYRKMESYRILLNHLIGKLLDDNRKERYEN